MTVELPFALHLSPPRTRAVVEAEANVEQSAGVAASLSLLQWGILFAITALASGLRLWGLDDWSIWVDEGHTWRDVSVPLDQFFEQARRWYPTSYLMLRGLLELGVLPHASEGLLRLPFALCGIATIPLLALYGRHLVGTGAALLAALYLALDPWHLYWSQNARAYALVVLFGMVAAGEFWLGRQQRSRRRTAFAFGWLALAATCHPTSLVLLPSFVLVLVLDSRRCDGRRLVAMLLLIVGLLLVLEPLLLLLPPFRGFQDAKQDVAPSLMHWLQTTVFYFRLPLLCAAACGACMVVRKRLEGPALHLLCWAAVPIVLFGVVGAGMVKVTARYALIALPAVMLLAGVASMRLFELAASADRTRRLAFSLLLPVLLCGDFASCDYLYLTVQCGDRGRWRDASEYVQQAAGGAPCVVHTTHEPVLAYYLQPDRYRSEASAVAPDVFDLRSIETHDIAATANGASDAGGRYVRSIIERARREQRVPFFLAALPELAEKDADGTLRAALLLHCELLLVLPLWIGPKDESIYIWRAR